MSETRKFWTEIRRKIVVFSTMERDVRITFIAGSAVVALATALDLFGGHLGPEMRTLVGSVPLGTVIFLIIGEILVFTFIGFALLEMKGRPLWICVGVLAASLVAVMAINGPFLSLGLLVPALLQCILMIVSNRRRWDAQRNVRAALATASVMLSTLAAYAVVGQGALVISVIAFQGTAAMLGLFMAATDIAEITALAAEVSATALRRLTRLRIPLSELQTNPVIAVRAFIAALLAIAADIWVGSIYTGGSAREMAHSLGGGLGVALWIGLIYWMLTGAGKRLEAIPAHIGYLSLLAVVAIYFIAFQVGMLWRLLSDPATYDPKELFTYPEVFTPPLLIFLSFVISFFLLGRSSAKRFVLLGFGSSVGMLWFHYYASHGEELALINATVAMGSLVLLFVALGRRKIAFVDYSMLLCEVNVCFALYGIVALAFWSARGGPGKLTVEQAAIVFMALAWDIISSGETVSNKHSEQFPRIARVAAFFAYVVSVALMVMVSTTSQLVNPVSSQEVEGVFEAEPLVAAGLTLFGVPFFILIFSLRMRPIVRVTTLPQQPHTIPTPSPGTTVQPQRLRLPWVGQALALVVFAGLAVAVVAGLLAWAWQPLVQWVAAISIMKFLLAHWGHALAPLILGICGQIFRQSLSGLAAFVYAASMTRAGFDDALFESVRPYLVDPDPLKQFLWIPGFVGLLLIGFIIYSIGSWGRDSRFRKS
jgi:hypothetical protein